MIDVIERELQDKSSWLNKWLTSSLLPVSGASSMQPGSAGGEIKQHFLSHGTDCVLCGKRLQD